MERATQSSFAAGLKPATVADANRREEVVGSG
jgi:hypothetical protein